MVITIVAFICCIVLAFIVGGLFAWLNARHAEKRKQKPSDKSK